MNGTPIDAETAETAWFDRLTMSALILSLSKDADSASSAFDAVARRLRGN
jgi:hypothetical protein